MPEPQAMLIAMLDNGSLKRLRYKQMLASFHEARA
jgi:hypothetical protein